MMTIRDRRAETAMRGLPWLLSLAVLFMSPGLVVMAWFALFSSIVRRTSNSTKAAITATFAAAVMVVAFARLAIWVFGDASP